MYTGKKTFILTTEALQGAKTTGQLHTGLTTDVTSAVQALVGAGQSYIIFQWTGNSGSADLQGKASNYAPTLVITTADASSTTSYTVNFLDESGTALKEAVTYADQVIGVSASASEEDVVSFYNDDASIKYVYASGNEAITLGGDVSANVINLTFKAYTKQAYTVVAKVDGAELTTLTSGEDYLDGAMNVGWSKYIQVDGKWYEAAAPYSKALTSSSNEVAYSETATALDYFFEVENLANVLTPTAGANYSGGAYSAVTGGKKASLGVLPPGEYKVTAYLVERGDRGIYLRDVANTDNASNVIGNMAIDKNSAAGECSLDITLNASTELAITGYTSGTSTNQSSGIDYIYIQRTGDVTETITLPADYTYSTFCSPYALDFSDNADVKAYTAAVNGTSVVLTEVTGAVPAYTGLILEKQGENTTATVKVAAAADEVYGNLLKGVKEAMAADALVADNAYVLVDDNTFSKVAENATGTLAAGKAYLCYAAAAAGARPMTLYIGGNPTAVQSVDGKADAQENVIYNLQGIRVQSPTTPGIYIVNGKAVVF